MKDEEMAEEYIEKICKIWEEGERKNMLDKFYEICKFIVCLCGTILIVLFTVASIYVCLK